MSEATRKCPTCKRDFPLNKTFACKTRRGWRSRCKVCYNEFRRQRDILWKAANKSPNTPPTPEEQDERVRRLLSDFEHIHPEDFDTSVGNDGKKDPKAAREKRQEFSRTMGTFSEALSGSRGDPEKLGADLGSYIGALAEQERRFGNRRIARSVSLIAAHEELNRRLFKQAAQMYLKDKVTPTGYAAKRHTKPIKRTVVALFSDLHLGADLSPIDNPMPFRAVEEARRLEFFTRQILDFKPQYRDNSELVILLNGDLIDGLLLHDLRDGIPLTEQKVVFWRYFRTIIGLCAQTYPKVRVICQPGNHGRDKLRHPGRATSSKWDGHEWEMMYALAQMCSSLKNVTFDNTMKAYAVVELHGSWMLVTHGDTEIKLSDPDTKFKENSAILDRINSQLTYGQTFSLFAAGHFHKARYQVHAPSMIWNGALLPPNGHARTSGYLGEPCGQWIWEATEGFPAGDLRFIPVGPAQDHDEKLGTLIAPFRFESK